MCESLALGRKIICDYSEHENWWTNEHGILLQQQNHKKAIQIKYLQVRLKLINQTRELQLHNLTVPYTCHWKIERSVKD